MNWQQKIEAQIGIMRALNVVFTNADAKMWANTMQALLDVAVAADEITNGPHKNWPKLRDALDKLREVE